jgi:DNA-directed RNA polymerase specialized sigma24 family protein
MLAEPGDEYLARARGRQAEALGLHEEGLSYSQIGQRLGITRGAAAGLVRRARQNHVAAPPEDQAWQE